VAKEEAVEVALIKIIIILIIIMVEEGEVVEVKNKHNKIILNNNLEFR
jgi:hypothetical protein